jgi:branched-subunit amino acid aminotransferase/4-amino-4-deoxychorismate lyase
MQWLYLNGSLVQSDEAAISALDRAVFHGRALVETFAARDGRVSRLEAHYRRLCDSAPVLGLAVPLTLAALESAVAAVLDRNSVTDARLRLTLTAGPGDGAPGSVTLTDQPLTDYPPEQYERGMHATVAAVRRNETSPLSRIKCAAGLLDGLLAREAARAAGFDEAIMLNTRGLVAEATVANVFIVKGNRLLTPTLESGALPGVTRAAVLALARDSGLDPTETEVSLDDLRTADEAFLTNAVMGVMPLTRLDGAAIGDGCVGGATERAANGLVGESRH